MFNLKLSLDDKIWIDQNMTGQSHGHEEEDELDAVPGKAHKHKREEHEEVFFYN